MPTQVTPDPNAFKQGDTFPLIAALSDTFGLLDLTGSTVRIRMASAVVGVGHPPIDNPCDVIQATDPTSGSIINKGRVSYSWGVGETDDPGVYNVEFAVTFPDNSVRTFPSDGYMTLEIEPTAT